MNKIIVPGNFEGIVKIPSSKSDSQRVILAAGLAKGTSLIKNIGICSDEAAMLEAIRTLGAQIRETENGTEITGVSKVPSGIEVNVSESGLAARLLSGVFAFSEGQQTVQGHGSVLSRKMSFYFKHANELQCRVSGNKDNMLPLTFHNTISSSDFTVNGGESSQDISGLLYGLAFSGKAFNMHVLHLKSKPYLQMTLDTLSKFGIVVTHQNFEFFSISENNGLQACSHTIEGDWSSASFWLVAAALGKNIAVDGIQLSSLQADKQLLNILTNANCTVLRSQFLTVDGAKRTPVTADLTHSPDLFPALTTYAALTPGTSYLKGVHRLYNKESNRTAALMEEFSKLGVVLSVEGDTLIVEGKNYINGGIVHSHNDHRIAMCLAIAGMFATSPVTIEQAESVGKSYPQFWEHLELVQAAE